MRRRLVNTASDDTRLVLDGLNRFRPSTGTTPSKNDEEKDLCFVFVAVCLLMMMAPKKRRASKFDKEKLSVMSHGCCRFLANIQNQNDANYFYF